MPNADSVSDLGVSYDNKLSYAVHTDKIVSKASLRSKLILNCFQSRNPTMLVKAFCTFVRPTLEYCSVVWSPGFKIDIHRLEAVQRRFTKRLAGLHDMSYWDRLDYLNLDCWTVYIINFKNWTSVQHFSVRVCYLSHVENSKNHFVMTIVMWIRVHPYKATHSENRKSILRFIAFMVLHTDSHHSDNINRHITVHA